VIIVVSIAVVIIISIAVYFMVRKFKNQKSSLETDKKNETNDG
jgi:hypothetical protein